MKDKITLLTAEEANRELAELTTSVVSYKYDWLLSNKAMLFSWLLNCSEVSDECEKVLKVQGWVSLKK